MNDPVFYRLMIDLTFIKKGTIFVFYNDTAFVHWIDRGKETQYPLRTGLAGYLWLLRTEGKYMRKVKELKQAADTEKER